MTSSAYFYFRDGWFDTIWENKCWSHIFICDYAFVKRFSTNKAKWTKNQQNTQSTVRFFNENSESISFQNQLNHNARIIELFAQFSIGIFIVDTLKKGSRRSQVWILVNLVWISVSFSVMWNGVAWNWLILEFVCRGIAHMMCWL